MKKSVDLFPDARRLSLKFTLLTARILRGNSLFLLPEKNFQRFVKRFDDTEEIPDGTQKKGQVALPLVVQFVSFTQAYLPIDERLVVVYVESGKPSSYSVK